MVMKKHPVVYGLLFVLLVGAAILAIFFVSGALTGYSGSISQSNRIGIVSITGIISNSQDIVNELDEFGKNSSIRAVVIRIDSPGGGVASSQEIYSAVKTLKKNKKVVA